MKMIKYEISLRSWNGASYVEAQRVLATGAGARGARQLARQLAGELALPGLDGPGWEDGQAVLLREGVEVARFPIAAAP